MKYRKPDVAPRIHISAHRNDGFWTISVRDHGIGFDPEQAERIFGVFQRLHGADFAGTGIGLTICKRIVERHGGRIWAEAKPNEGAVFSFSIPLDGKATRGALPHLDAATVSRLSVPNPARLGSVVPSADYFDELFRMLDLAQATVRGLDDKILIWTEGAHRLFGWTEEEAIGEPMHQLLRTDFPTACVEIEAKLLQKGEWTGELRVTKRDGTVMWVASHWSLYRDGSGRPQSVIEVNNKITPIKDAETALQQSTEKLDLALRAGQMGIWNWDKRTGVVEWSDAIEGMVGMEPGSFERTYEAFARRIHPEDIHLVQEGIAEAFERGPDYHVEFRMLHVDGTAFWVRGQGQVVFDDRSQPQGLIGVVWRITAVEHGRAGG